MGYAEEVIAFTTDPWARVLREDGLASIERARAAAEFGQQQDLLRQRSAQAMALQAAENDAALKRARVAARLSHANALALEGERSKNELAKSKELAIQTELAADRRRQEERENKLATERAEAIALGYQPNLVMLDDSQDMLNYTANFKRKEKLDKEAKAVSGLAQIIRQRQQDKEDLNKLSAEKYRLPNSELAVAMVKDPALVKLAAKKKIDLSAPETAIAELRKYEPGLVAATEEMIRPKLEEMGLAIWLDNKKAKEAQLRSRNDENLIAFSSFAKDLPPDRLAEAFEAAGVARPNDGLGGGGVVGGGRVAFMAAKGFGDQGRAAVEDVDDVDDLGHDFREPSEYPDNAAATIGLIQDQPNLVDAVRAVMRSRTPAVQDRAREEFYRQIATQLNVQPERIGGSTLFRQPKDLVRQRIQTPDILRRLAELPPEVEQEILLNTWRAARGGNPARAAAVAPGAPSSIGNLRRLEAIDELRRQAAFPQP